MSCLALGTVGTPGTSLDESPAPSPQVVAQTLQRDPRGALCSRRCWQSCGNQHTWKPSKLPTPLYKSLSKTLIPKKFNPGSVTRLHSQLCTHPREGGKMPSGERAVQEGRGPRCFHAHDPLNKCQAGQQDRPTCREPLQNKSFFP